MVEEAIGTESDDVLEIYGIFTAAVYISAALGGLLGDLVLKNKLAMLIGGGMQITGIFTFYLFNEQFLYPSMILIALGSGFYSTNFLAQFGKHYIHKPRIAEAGFTVLYLAVNAGASIGIILIGFLADINYFVAFLGAGVAMVLATGLIFVLPSPRIEGQELEDKRHSTSGEVLDDGYFHKGISSQNIRVLPMGKKILLLGACLITAAIFWAAYEWVYSLQNYQYGSTNWGWMSDYLDPGLLLLFGIGTFFLWNRVYYGKYLKLSIGIFSMAIAFALMGLRGSFDNQTVWFILFSLILAIGEIHMSPVIHSAIVKHVKGRFLGIAFGLLSIHYLLMNRLFLSIENAYSEQISMNPRFYLWSIFGLLFVLAVVLLVLSFFRKLVKA